MLASELIIELTKIMEQHGDLPVAGVYDGYQEEITRCMVLPALDIEGINEIEKIDHILLE